MAELDIIDLWEKGKKSTSTDHLKRTLMDTGEMLKTKSKSDLHWIRIMLLVEFWINLVALPIGVYELGRRELWLELFGFIGFITGYLVYYFFLIRKIKSFDYSRNVKAGLTILCNYLNFFIWHYKVVLILSLVVGMTYGSYLQFQKAGATPPSNGLQWLSFLTISAIIVLTVYLVLNYLINWVYGRKIERLRRTVREFDEL